MAHMMASRASIGSLDNDTLGVISLLLPQTDRLRTLPLVCHRWCDLLRQACMWPVVDLEPWHLRLACAPDHAGNICKWLHQRGPGMREIALRALTMKTLQPALLSVVPTAARLQRLLLLTDEQDTAVMPHGHSPLACLDIQDLACISHMTFLTRLEVSFIGTPLQPPTLDDFIGSLPALQHLCLHFSTPDLGCLENLTGNARKREWRVRPVDFPHSLLSCTQLTSLDLSMHDPHSLDTMFTVGGLPDGITALQQLQHLRLGDCVTAPLNRSISNLTRLTSLELLQDGIGFLNPIEPAQALPASLRSLTGTEVYVDALTALTALECLTLFKFPDVITIGGQPTNTCTFSMLRQLTALELEAAFKLTDQELHAFAGCTGLRRLHLGRLSLNEAVVPLPYQQLTWLRLRMSDHNTGEVLTMISALPRLEQLEVTLTSQIFDLFALDAMTLSQWPQLRLVDVSRSRLWASDPSSAPDYWHPQRRKVAPMHVVEQLMRLQRARPCIEWVLRESVQQD